jgi:ABC-2 type transport system permease protein
MKWGISAMPSKMSLFNKELLLQIGRSMGWVSLIYFFTLFFIIPIKILMILHSKEDIKYYQTKTSLFEYEFQIQMGLMIVIPVLLAVLLFRFLHVKQANDLIHSLPIKRDKIYHHYALAGIFLLVAPILLNSIILLFLYSFYDIETLFTVIDIFFWAGTTLTISLLLYTASVFIAMMTGISAVQIVLTYIFVLFPTGFILLLFTNLNILLYGFPSSYFLRKQLENLSPITFAAELEGRITSWKILIVYVILAVVLYGLALFFYKKRKLETASEAISVAKLRSIFKYGASFCFMLFGGAYFHMISYENIGWTVFGYVVGAAFGYFAAEMVLQKTWRVFTKFKGLAIFLGFIAFLVIGSQAFGFYERKVPEQSEIKRVLVGDNPSFYFDSQDGFTDNFNNPKPLKDPQNIAAVRTLHEQIIADKAILKESKNDIGTTIFFIYELKNGKKVVREYHVMMELYKDLYKPIYESEEFKRNSKEIFMVDETKVKNIVIAASGSVRKEVTLSDPKDVQKAISLIKEDVLAESFEDSVYFQFGGSTMELQLGLENSLIFELKPTYVKFYEWLKEKNLFDQAKVTAKDISKVVVAKGEFSPMDSEEVKRKVEQNGDSLKITDKEQIDRALETAGGNYEEQYSYVAVFYYNNGEDYEVLYFDEEHVPDFVRSHFK